MTPSILAEAAELFRLEAAHAGNAGDTAEESRLWDIAEDINRRAAAEELRALAEIEEEPPSRAA